MLEERPVVTCFVRHRGEVLLVRRSKEVGSYRGRWGAVAGHVENDDPDASALREIREETGLDESVRLAERGEPFAVEDESLGTRWRVHPYLFDSASRDARLDWEATEGEWTSPTEILRRDVVPRLWTSYERVAPTLETILRDREHGSAYVSLRALEVLRDRAGALDARGLADEQAWTELRELAEKLLAARPAMAVIENRIHAAMHRARKTPSARAVEREAHEGIRLAIASDDESSRRAGALVAGKRVLTLSRSGTVTAALLGSEPPPLVVVAESRPAREGVGVAEELARSGLSVGLVTDAGIASALESFDVELVLVGADRVLPRGDAVNKTGTRLAALAARERGLPFYVVAATDKFSISEAPSAESGSPDEIYEGDAPLDVRSPTFEATPAALVTGIATERGVLLPAEVREVVRELERFTDWRG